jgi:predicted CopG family antitoxin
MEKKREGWTSIAIRVDTHERLDEMKITENFDDVIRRGMGMPPIKKTEEKQ